MLGNFAVLDAEEVIVAGGLVGKAAFADGQHEVAAAENLVDFEFLVLLNNLHPHVSEIKNTAVPAAGKVIKRQEMSLFGTTSFAIPLSINTKLYFLEYRFLLCTFLDYSLRDKPDSRMLALMLASSLLFALAHCTEFSAFNIEAILCMTELFGLGLIACWLIFNLGFWWACLLHALNNIIALLITFLMPTPLTYTPTAVEFDTPLYSASLQPMQGDTIDIREINDSTMVFMGNLPCIALNLVREFHPSIIDDLYSPTECFHILPNFSYKAERPRWKYTLTFHDTIPYRHAP